MRKFKFYAVATGRHKGVYSTWGETKNAIKRLKKPKYKGFQTKKAAEKWLKEQGVTVRKKRKKIHCRDTGETVSSYKAYLNTKHWREFRKKIYERYNHRCARCRKEIPLSQGNVHHKTYEHIGHEWLRDVTFLCIECHKLVHEKGKKK